jgi:hypothetical protein
LDQLGFEQTLSGELARRLGVPGAGWVEMKPAPVPQSVGLTHGPQK